MQLTSHNNPIKSRYFIPFLFVFAYLLSNQSFVEAQSLSIIPMPKSVSIDTVSRHTLKLLYIDRKDVEGFSYVSQLLEQSTLVKFDNKKPNVFFKQLHSIADGAYSLYLQNDRLTISFGNDLGKHYALVSLAQLCASDTLFPFAFQIMDEPGFSYRGMHLDVCRHFFTVEEIKKYIDFLTYYKFNTFHWHLTDDQGWRIEIKKYPLLQSISSFRDGTLIGHYNDTPHKFSTQKYGGYYSQDEIKEVINYALQRKITIIPEIEMPGHARAALAAYPNLRCNGEVEGVAQKWGIFEEVFCPTDATFIFLQDVLDEVISLFPGKYIHIGGDECPKKEWEESPFCQHLIDSLQLKDEHGLQSYFINRIEQFVNSKGKQIIGWDEILEGGLAPNATIMSWRGEQGGIDAAKLSHDVIMTPGSHCYFDHYQSESENEPLAIGGYTNMAKVYNWKVVPKALDSTFNRFIIGGQANLWTEYIPTFSHVEYMAFARGMALAEALWKTNNDYSGFLQRFEIHTTQWKSRGTNIANHTYELFPKTTKLGNQLVVSFDNVRNEKISISNPNNRITFIEPTSSIPILQSGSYSFSYANHNTAYPKVLSFDLHRGVASSIKLLHLPNQKYFGSGKDGLINGLYGSNNKFGGNEWLGFAGTDCSGQLEFQTGTEVNEISMRFFHAPGQWIYMPKSVDITLIDDEGVESKHQKLLPYPSDEKIINVRFPLENKNIKFLQFNCQNFGTIPNGGQGAGYGAWLFIDEITVK